MKTRSTVVYLLPATLALTGIPLLIWATGDHPDRTVLKDSLSLLTLLSFCLMLGQFYLARGNRGAVEALRLGGVMRIHKIVGYTFIGILLAHPFFIVLPRALEGGVEPMDAFVTLVTTFDSTGVVLGLVAWALLLTLLITAFVRRRLPLKAGVWRIIHGVLSLLFVSTALWHSIDLGRHTDRALSIALVVIAVGGAALLLKRYAGKAEVAR